jgi:hypothetical protein
VKISATEHEDQESKVKGRERERELISIPAERKCMAVATPNTKRREKQLYRERKKG